MRLTVSDMSHSFGSRQLFDNLFCQIRSGEMVALMGPSGSGKSTLLSMIAGAITPDAGTVRFEEHEVPHLVWIVQATPLLARRTALENVALGPLSEGVSDAEAGDRAQAAMSRLGVLHTSSSKVFRLSGGERQRIAVSRAIASSAKVILADEPTASLDPDSRSDVVDALRVAADLGAIVLVSTHDAAVAMMCDWTINLGQGHLRAAVAPKLERW